MNLPKVSSSRSAPTKSRLPSVLPPATAHSTRDRPQATLSWGPEPRREHLGQSGREVHLCPGFRCRHRPSEWQVSLPERQKWVVTGTTVKALAWPLLKWKVEREKETPALSSRYQDVRPCPSGGESRGHKSPGGKLPGFYTKGAHVCASLGNVPPGWWEVL
jgi:hypothetical protein